MINEETYLDESAIEELGSKLSDIWSDLDVAFTMSVELLNNVKNDKLWMGNSEKTFEAYMDLLLQYHNKFSKTYSEDNPMQLAEDTFKQFSQNVEDFYGTDFVEYQGIKGLI